MKKKVVAAILVTCMAVSLTACGSKDSSDKTPGYSPGMIS